VIGDPGHHIAKLGPGIDVFELGRSNQCQHDCGALAATIGPPRNNHDLRPRAIPPQLILGCIVAQADATVVEEAGEDVDAPEHVVHGLRHLRGDVGKLEQLASRMCPASGFRDRSRLSIRRVECIDPA
jgi:hypothetical protein